MLFTHYVPRTILSLAARDIRQGFPRAYAIAATPAEQTCWNKMMRRFSLNDVVVYKTVSVSR